MQSVATQSSRRPLNYGRSRIIGPSLLHFKWPSAFFVASITYIKLRVSVQMGYPLLPSQEGRLTCRISIMAAGLHFNKTWWPFLNRYVYYNTFILLDIYLEKHLWKVLANTAFCTYKSSSATIFGTRDDVNRSRFYFIWSFLRFRKHHSLACQYGRVDGQLKWRISQHFCTRCFFTNISCIKDTITP